MIPASTPSGISWNMFSNVLSAVFTCGRTGANISDGKPAIAYTSLVRRPEGSTSPLGMLGVIVGDGTSTPTPRVALANGGAPGVVVAGPPTELGAEVGPANNPESRLVSIPLVGLVTLDPAGTELKGPKVVGTGRVRMGVGIEGFVGSDTGIMLGFVNPGNRLLSTPEGRFVGIGNPGCVFGSRLLGTPPMF